MSRESDRNHVNKTEPYRSDQGHQEAVRDGSIMRLGGEEIAQVEVIPTGSLSLDLRWVGGCRGAASSRSTARSLPARQR